MYGLNDRIQRVIKERNLTLTEIAKSAQISRETISGIVNGRQMPRRSTINALAEALGVEPEFLTSAKFDEPSTGETGTSKTNVQGTGSCDSSSLLETLGLISVAAETDLITEDERLVCQRVIARLISR